MSAAALRDPVSLSIGRMTVRFSWCHDRWAHQIVLPDGTTWQSFEGPAAQGGDPRWPASPVLVELSRLPDASGPAVLGVGCAGRSHFSASVAPAPGHPDHLRFDIACRVTESPGWLGSTYVGPQGIVRVLPCATAVEPPATVRWGYDLGCQGILPLGRSRADMPAPGDGPHLAIDPPIDQIREGCTLPSGNPHVRRH